MSLEHAHFEKDFYMLWYVGITWCQLDTERPKSKLSTFVGMVGMGLLNQHAREYIYNYMYIIFIEF